MSNYILHQTMNIITYSCPSKSHPRYLQTSAIFISNILHDGWSVERLLGFQVVFSVAGFCHCGWVWAKELQGARLVQSLLVPYKQSTMQWCYNVVKFLQTSHNRHLIAHPWGRGVGCLSCVQILVYVLPRVLCVILCTFYHVNREPD